MLVGGALGYNTLFPIELVKGRYPNVEEVQAGRNIAIIGHEIATALFPNGEEAIGKEIKVKNMKYVVIGVIKKEGQSFMGTPSNDFNVIVPYNSFRRMYQTGTGRWNEVTSRIGIK